MRIRFFLTGSALLLLPLLGAARPAAPDDPQAVKQLQELERRLTEERAVWSELKQHAQTEAERAELAAAFPRDEFVPALTALANANKGTELAARAWVDLFRISRLIEDRALHAQALQRLTSEHVTSPEVANLTLMLVYGAPPWTAPDGAEALRKILAGNKDVGVQQACLAELALLVGMDESFGEAGRAEAEALLVRIEKEYSDVDFNAMTGKQFAAGARHEIQALRVGQVAPDFELADQDGVRFKLSDYRGRVVVLDFWGFV
ncbi:MAG: redoxin domain-containing protein [Planctomycetes bacterium]|nr:redoxin domain-containing protein [Planctomycetota bacterium]